MRLRELLLVFTLGVLSVSNAWAQSQITSGMVQGDVLDEKGGSVPGANVEAKNLDTNYAATATTNEAGHFAFLSLVPGRYTVTVSKEGFATVLQENVVITVGQTITLPTTMKVSTVAQQIVVTDVPVVETTSTEQGSTLDETAISQTPVLGRKFEDLLTLTPGVSIVQGPDGDEINFNGQRGIFNNISLDGGDYNNGFFGEQMGGQRAAIDITLDAVKEFQVVAAGANAEFGRTAGGVVNVVTKSGTNQFHGSAFEYQRLEALTAATSDGKPLNDFHREQFGGTFGGPIKKDKVFFFASGEGILENLSRTNLGAPIGTPCAISNPVFGSNITDAQINASGDCQRLTLINFFKSKFNDSEGLPVDHQQKNAATLGRLDYDLSAKNQFSVSYNFDYSRNPNQTFDVPTYGTSANGIEGPSKIQTVNANWFTTLSTNALNEAHFTYGRENRPREAIASGLPDTGAGFAPSFRFGMPFFLGPNVNEVFWRIDLRDNFSLIRGKHTIKFGGEYLHSNNSQIFRGFFEGRYLFDSVDGLLRYASPAALNGFGPHTGECLGAGGAFTGWITFGAPFNQTCAAGSSVGGPLLLYLQDGPASTGETSDQAGFSSINNEEFALFVQDTYKVTRNITLNYGLRWEAQHFPSPVVPPAKTAYGVNLSNPNFPSNGTEPNQNKEFQPRIGFAWDIMGKGKSALHASWGIYNARQNMLTEVGAITTNGIQLQSFASASTFGIQPTYPGTVALTLSPPGTIPTGVGVTVFDRNYANPRIYTTNVGFEQQLAGDYTAYADFTWSKGVHLTRFVNPNVGTGFTLPTVGSDTVNYTGAPPFANLGAITDTISNAKSLYRGVTFGVHKRLSHRFLFDANYTYSVDKDDDSNERDPFTFRYANLFNLAAEYANSDRDERHKFNFYSVTDLPWGFHLDVRMQAHSAQPITDNVLGTGTGAPCNLNNSLTRFVIPSGGGTAIDCGRNHLRKDNQFFTFDFGLQRDFHLGERFTIIPKLEMFNLFNNANNVNPLTSPALFNFDGFLRDGVGDPRQAQLSVRLTF